MCFHKPLAPSVGMGLQNNELITFSLGREGKLDHIVCRSIETRGRRVIHQTLGLGRRQTNQDSSGEDWSSKTASEILCENRQIVLMSSIVSLYIYICKEWTCVRNGRVYHDM